MKKLYKRFEEIEGYAHKGLLTIKEANDLMLEAIEKYYSEYLMSDDVTGWNWDSMKAYHKMYLILAKLTRD